MYKFSDISRNRLKTCDILLQQLFEYIIIKYDCSIICGYRGKTEQNRAFKEGKSKKKYPESKHNTFPSRAVDVAPYIAGKGISWDKDQCYYFAGYVKGIADSLNIPIRCGADWDKDNDINNQIFNDLVHFEISD